MLKPLFLSFGLLLPNWAFAQDCVILLHGLARSEASFALMARSLRGQGYHVVAPEFSTRGKPIESLVSETLPEAVAGCGARRLHFVTHSLGGIMVRAYLAWAKPEKLGHVVMLGPPNKGSEVVDALKALAAFDWVNGLAGRQLGTDAGSFPNRLPKVNFRWASLPARSVLTRCIPILSTGQMTEKFPSKAPEWKGCAII